MEMATAAGMRVVIVIWTRLPIVGAVWTGCRKLVIQRLAGNGIGIHRMYISRRRTNQHGRDQTSCEPYFDAEDESGQTHDVPHNRRSFKNH
ncbi:MAG: hypothetical protein VR75_03200 [Hyphomonadaceae bacterium BRH_c29]|jgi:hypothetical protein|nr:MAG: hypothetical protein VR75_03200 [Hyphomonadaceae bacterium BRH_c29]